MSRICPLFLVELDKIEFIQQNKTKHGKLNLRIYSPTMQQHETELHADLQSHSELNLKKWSYKK